jgi:DNA-binding NtrC family response regulator
VSIDDRATEDAEAWAIQKTAGQLHLVVLAEEAVSSHPMPSRGRVTIGRGETNDVRIDHALISREHAVIDVDNNITLTDLGSRNGTKVRGEKLETNEPKALVPGQVIEIGSVMLIIQEASAGSKRRRLQTHGYFEARLEEHCERAAHRAFAVLRLRVDSSVETARVEGAVASLLAPADVAAAFAPLEFEVLLVDADEARAETMAQKLEERIGAVEIGVAVHPRDGKTPDALLERAGEALRARDEETSDQEPIVVLEPAMRDLYRIGERVAQGAISVLLLGETGAGKEVFAEAIHRSSPRKHRSFVRINCAALAETLLESELFGHEKGAFTGAVRAKPGLLETADGGTVMLDELGEMPGQTQAKMLRVLEQKQVLRVGGLEPKDIDVRFISATNRDLEQEVMRGNFRRDLYFRLNGVTLVIPPLRSRQTEIAPLADRFVTRVARELGRDSAPRISRRAMELLLGYEWPGNIRELRNVMERAVLLAGDSIEPEHLPFEKMTMPRSNAMPVETPAVSLEDSKDERERILRALEACGGNQTRAAKMLGIGRRTLTAKLTKYNMPRPRK